MSLRVASGPVAGATASLQAGGPRAVTVDMLDPAAELVSTSSVRPVGARLLAPAAIGAFARSRLAGSRFAGSRVGGPPVVVVGVEDEAAAAVAERLSALGVDAGWLIGGVQAWEGAGRAILGPAGEAA
ncbi:MAG: hypothetical protein Q8P18_17635 [Pseudomonadota bacterium]|nr:hypothetical protein [Pseudomonadota bacterium]